MKATIEYRDHYNGFLITWTKYINSKEYEYTADSKKEGVVV